MPGHYDRKDRFYLKAKADHYASRAVYKLQELDRQFHLFQKGKRVLDLGCAPGSWLQWISSRIGPTGLLIGVDLLPLHLPEHPNTEIIQGDFTDSAVSDAITARFGNQPPQVVVSDSAPNLSGILFADQERSLDLNTAVIAIARKLLPPGGKLVLKSFEGERIPELKARLTPDFTAIKRLVPEATRKTSREVYWIAQKKPA